jgi:hypothetical protein
LIVAADRGALLFVLWLAVLVAIAWVAWRR